MAGFLKNLLGKKSQDDSSEAPKTKKAQGYFLELDETGNVKSEAQAKKAEPTKATVATTESAKADKAEAKAAQKKPEPAQEKPKAKEAAPATKAAKEKVAPQPMPSQAPSNGKVEPQSGQTFAPNYLLPLTTNNGRRRPGPSMNNFLDMARQMKTPRK